MEQNKDKCRIINKFISSSLRKKNDHNNLDIPKT